MTNPRPNRNLQEPYNNSLVHLESDANSSHNPEKATEGKAESTTQTIVLLFGATALLTCLGYGGWLVFWSAVDVASGASFHDFIRCCL